MRRRWGRAARIAGGLAGGIVVLVVVLLTFFNGISLSRQHRRYHIADPTLEIPNDSAAVNRGRHLVTAVAACTSCHGSDLGGGIVIDQPLLGRFVAANLTAGPGGVGKRDTDQDLARAIRHGVGRSGQSLVFMPSDAFQGLSDRDLSAIIAYLRTVPPVDRKLPPTRVGPIGRTLHVLGSPLLPAERIDHHVRVVEPPARDNLVYGSHLATVAGCRGCHGPTLSGGAAPGPALTDGRLADWTEEDFRRAVREGRRPDGSRLAEPMPWRNFSGLTDDEVSALWRYLRSAELQLVRR